MFQALDLWILCHKLVAISRVADIGWFTLLYKFDFSFHRHGGLYFEKKNPKMQEKEPLNPSEYSIL